MAIEPDLTIDGVPIFFEPMDGDAHRVSRGNERGESHERHELHELGVLFASESGTGFTALRADGTPIQRVSRWSAIPNQAGAVSARFGTRELAVRALMNEAKD